MKNSVKWIHSGLSLMLLTTFTNLVDPVLARATPAPQIDEAVETRLTPAQIEELLPWAMDARRKLIDLLTTIRPLSDADALDTLRRGILEMYPDGNTPKRTEILMRYSLKRALKIDQDIVSGTVAGEVGAVEASLSVLRSSAQIAINHYESDVAYLQSLQKGESPKDVRFTEFGHQYSQMLMRQARAIINAKVQYSVAKSSIDWLKMDLSRDETNKTQNAPLIRQIELFGQMLPESSALQSDGQAVALMLKLQAFCRSALSTHVPEALRLESKDVKTWYRIQKDPVYVSSEFSKGEHVYIVREDHCNQATVKGIFPNGTYAVEYKSGDKTLLSSHVVARELAHAHGTNGTYTVGMPVTYNGDEHYYEGVVAGINASTGKVVFSTTDEKSYFCNVGAEKIAR